MKFPESAGVNCAKCGVKTAHSSRREHHSDLLFLEIIRVSRANTYWSKNYTCINFPLNGIVFPGSDRKYRVIATCNHKGTLHSGHWFTKLRMKENRWFALDDLQPKHLVTDAPGVRDSTTVLIAMIAEDKMSISLDWQFVDY